MKWRRTNHGEWVCGRYTIKRLLPNVYQRWIRFQLTFRGLELQWYDSLAEAKQGAQKHKSYHQSGEEKSV